MDNLIFSLCRQSVPAARRNAQAFSGSDRPPCGPHESTGYPSRRALTLQRNIGLSTDFQDDWRRNRPESAPAAVQRIAARSSL
ncbi:hypothetical protein ACTJKF_17905 [Burkholderia sp. 22313]